MTEWWRIILATVLALGVASLFVPWGRKVERLSSGSADFVSEADAPFRFMRGKEPMRLTGVAGWAGWAFYTLRAKYDKVDQQADRELVAMGFKAGHNHERRVWQCSFQRKGNLEMVLIVQNRRPSWSRAYPERIDSEDAPGYIEVHVKGLPPPSRKGVR